MVRRGAAGFSGIGEKELSGFRRSPGHRQHLPVSPAAGEAGEARTYYLYAAKYADPHSPYHAALAWMYAGFVCYLQRDDAAAIAHARRATELCPSLLEAIYSHAKFAAAGGQADVAIPSLERAVRADRNYAIKARLDPDFEKIEAAVTELMERLRDEARQEAEAQWLPLRADLDRYAIPPGQMERLRAEIEAAIGQDTYFGYLDAPAKIRACRIAFEGLRLPERDRLREEASELLARLRAEMTEYQMPDAWREHWEGTLAEAEQLLAGIPTCAEAQRARDQVSACEGQWKEKVTAGWKLAVLEGHTDSVRAIAFSPDGATLASGLATTRCGCGTWRAGARGRCCGCLPAG